MFSIDQKPEKYMSLVVTHECNKACSFCVDQYRGSGEFIGMDDVERALLAAKKTGVEDILIVGGEPTLHPYIVDIASLIKEAGFRSIITTNYTMPLVVKSLDGVVDCFNISYYNQCNLPRQENMESDLTIHALIHKQSLSSKFYLDNFIDQYHGTAHLKFSTLTPCNPWAKRNQEVPYVDSLDCEWVVLFNEILGQLYRGAIIKRYDRVINKTANQSLKAHVDGEISFSWNRLQMGASTIADNSRAEMQP